MNSLVKRIPAFAVASALTMGLALGSAGVANAAPADMDAPYARAAAKVSQDSSLLSGKNVRAVTRAASNTAGLYCVYVSDPKINLADAAITATISSYRGMITAIGDPHHYCGGATDAITIVTSNIHGAPADLPFTVVVH
ncbi:hypothetical protein [Streptomyces sp. NPDC006267]|uniref:hypothetical protein n=1 Tax=Streptomyces sp. NPDC006267 TaxID=3157173 RepID=UPI0033B1C97B